MELLKERGGYLDEPYSKHIKGKIRELRVDFARKHHRIFYFAFVGKKIILLHAFLKKSEKPLKEKSIERQIIITKQYLTKKNMNKLTNYEKHFKLKIKDKEFKEFYQKERHRLEIAYKIVQLRKKRHFSQKELAQKLGTTQSVIARIETGQQNLTSDTLQKIAEIFRRNLKIEFVK